MKQEQNPARPEEDQCAICLMPCVNPVKCKGPCHKSFCIKCVLQSKFNSKNACPNRCSQPFQVELPSPSLRCPFKPEDCNITISAGYQLADHFKLCLFISPEQRHAQSLKRNYQCNEGHRLIFLDEDAFQLLYGRPLCIIQTNHLCSQCNEDKLCRSLCVKCSTRERIVGFCVNCRPYPCTKSLCPMGHRLRKSNKVGKDRYCDICQLPAQLISNTAYGYCRCGFDLCQNCHENLAQQNELIPVKYNATNLVKLATEPDQGSSESEWKE